MTILECIIKYNDELKSYASSEVSYIKKLDSICTNPNDLKRKVLFSLAQKAYESTLLYTEHEVPRALQAATKLRGMLEILIVAKLCESDARYLLATVISFHSRELSFVQAIHDCISKSVTRLDELEKQDYIKIHEQIKNKENIVGIDEASLPFAGAIGLYDLDALEHGFSFSSNQVKIKILPLYDAEIVRIKKTENDFYKKLFNEQFFKKNFPSVMNENGIKKGINEYLSKCKLERWQDKALKTGLEDDYKSVYKLTSDVMHVTSMSLFTKSALGEGEKDFYLRMSYIYIKEITLLINRMSTVSY